MSTADGQVTLTERRSRQRRHRLAALHAAGLTYLVICALSMAELRGTALGAAIWTAVGATMILLALGRVARRRGWVRGGTPRRPLFSSHTWAGLVLVGVAAFGVVECLNTDLPGTFCRIVGIGAPLSRWFFVMACVFGAMLLYGVLAVAMGTGLGIRSAEEGA